MSVSCVNIRESSGRYASFQLHQRMETFTELDFLNLLPNIEKTHQPPTPPPTPLEEDVFSWGPGDPSEKAEDEAMDTFFPPGDPAEANIQAPAVRDPTKTLCPVPGCGKSVVRIWNHVFSYHKKTGIYTSKLIYISTTYFNVCMTSILLILCIPVDEELQAFLNTTQTTHMKRRTQWTEKEEAILMKELRSISGVPSRKHCQDILDKYRDTEPKVFIGRNKVHVQYKCIKLVKKMK